MDIENNKEQTPKYTMAGEPGSDDATAKSALKRGAEVYGQTEQSASDVHDKTAQTVSETYEQGKSYSSKNPGQDNSYRIRNRSWPGASLGCKRSSLAHRQVCTTCGQRTFRNCAGGFPLNRFFAWKNARERLFYEVLTL
jgi:hypothetical protein